MEFALAQGPPAMPGMGGGDGGFGGEFHSNTSASTDLILPINKTFLSSIQVKREAASALEEEVSKGASRRSSKI